ncbi:MAG: hypothetical protein MI923_09585, partial [Phycisphaerales bacterium]|nr:hypothetical protein [Phycisphaerales bacterium]
MNHSHDGDCHILWRVGKEGILTNDGERLCGTRASVVVLRFLYANGVPSFSPSMRKPPSSRLRNSKRSFPTIYPTSSQWTRHMTIFGSASFR